MKNSLTNNKTLENRVFTNEKNINALIHRAKKISSSVDDVSLMPSENTIDILSHFNINAGTDEYIAEESGFVSVSVRAIAQSGILKLFNLTKNNMGFAGYALAHNDWCATVPCKKGDTINFIKAIPLYAVWRAQLIVAEKTVSE